MAEQKPYPVDERGFPVAVKELNLPQIENGVYNWHHGNYYASLFGRFVISQTFRDLETFQTRQHFLTHELLHKLYGGILLPPFDNMIDRIEQGQAEGEQLRIRLSGGYVFHPITDIHIKTLHAEYNQINRSME